MYGTTLIRKYYDGAYEGKKIATRIFVEENIPLFIHASRGGGRKSDKQRVKNW